MIERDEKTTVGREASQIAVGYFHVEYRVVGRDGQVDTFEEVARDLLAAVGHLVEFVDDVERATVRAQLAAHQVVYDVERLATFQL